MHTNLGPLTLTTILAVSVGLGACSSSDGTSAPASDGGVTSVPTTDAGPDAAPGNDAGGDLPPVNAGDKDVPPTGAAADVKAWLALGDYKSGGWKCEDAPHAARSPSPHGTNRICSNATLSAHGAGEYPVGSAAVKELYNGGGTIVGYAVYRKLKAGGGEAWYWYEDMDGSVVANDTGDRGTAKSICVGCHSGAGSDAMHSGHDQVYTQVK